ncbi:uncharacterized protein LOC128232398 [Mya arenaria]|uniref:uncharacterized protein LOC128232398 n=1 Tax=Mya arenaria TaxID=6604 RepID=UPI0022E8F13E|nr:uncharacterized protein LOC128232398 [Mya arenaria]
MLNMNITANQCLFLGLLLFFPATCFCQNFRVLQDKRDGKKVFYSNDFGCSLPNKQIRFPELYETVSDASRVLSPPINFSATYLEKEANGGAPGVFYPGILDSFFESDYYNSERITSTRGYEISVGRIRSRMCFVVQLDEQWPREDLITVELFPMLGMTHYRVHATTLPGTYAEQGTDVIDVATGKWELNKNLLSPPPALWSPEIRYLVPGNASGKEVEIVFSRPPPEYGFKRYEIALASKTDVNAINVVVTSQFFYIFYGITPGEYKVMIRPIDEYFSVSDRCLCSLGNGACANCLTTRLETVTVQE